MSSCGNFKTLSLKLTLLVAWRLAFADLVLKKELLIWHVAHCHSTLSLMLLPGNFLLNLHARGHRW